MKNHRYIEKTTNRKSVSYYLESARDDSIIRKRKDYFGKSFTFMLIEDVHLGVVPIGGHSSNNKFRAILDPSNEESEQHIVNALEGNSRPYRREFGGAICDFIGNRAQSIMAYGEAPFEIAYQVEAGQEHISGFEFVSIQPKTVFDKRGKLVQYIPKEIRKRDGIGKYIELNREDIIQFNLPGNLRAKYIDMMDSLYYLSTNTLPEFTFQSPWSKSKRIPFESNVHSNLRNLALASAGKPIGWNARGLFNEAILEYYELWGFLRFEQFKIEIRDEILSAMNKGISRGLNKLGLSGVIKLEGLPRLKDVETARIHLENGDQPFKEILSPFLGY